MPIRDYAHDAELSKKALFSNQQVSQKNKATLKRYLEQYHVKPATKAKFFKHIRFVLEALPNFETQMNDRDLINKTFTIFRKKLSKGYIGTIINVSKAYARWLNDGELPEGFKDVKGIAKDEEKRDLRPEDMWTWDDGKIVADKTSSLQMKAIIATQLDAGMRPSEFVDIKYGDVLVKKDIVVFQVDGKRGKHSVPCHRCVPIFLKWYSSHPTKKKTDPLWIMENAEKSNKKNRGRKNATIKYDYFAIVKRLGLLAKKASVDKPHDFYTLRHSSCALDKLDNVPPEVAADRHGHTIAYFSKVYGRLDVDDIANRMRRHYTGAEEKRELEKHLTCETCAFVNEQKADLCFKCGRPLTVKKAMELEQQGTALIRKEIDLLKAENAASDAKRQRALDIEIKRLSALVTERLRDKKK